MGRTVPLQVSQRCIYDASRRSWANCDLAFPRMVFALSIFWTVVRFASHGRIGIFEAEWLTICVGLYCGWVGVLRRRTANRREEFREMLLPQMEDRYVRSLKQAEHVGISPGRRIDWYSGDSAWDVGFLVIEDGVLFYGDQSRFQLVKDDIVGVQVRGTRFLGRAPRLLIQYRAEYGGTAWLAIDVRGRLSLTQQIATLHHLRAQIALQRGGERRAGFALPMTGAARG